MLRLRVTHEATDILSSLNTSWRDGSTMLKPTACSAIPIAIEILPQLKA